MVGPEKDPGRRVVTEIQSEPWKEYPWKEIPWKE